MSTFNSPTDVVAGALAKSSDLNNLDAATAAGFALLPANANINAGTVNFAVDTGVANAYLVALPMIAASYGDGLAVVMRPLNANTGACTINVDSLGVKSIKTEANTTPAANDIMAGVPVELRYSTSTGFFHIIKNSAAQATAAAVSAAAALISQNAASASQSAAAGSQSAAAGSQSAAADSAAAALVSKNAAAASETAAGLSKTAAELAETNAETAETNAAASAAAALVSKNAAGVSAAAALVSENNAAASYDSFDDRYLGAKTADPTLDNDGNALLTGALYFNTVTSLMKVYSGSAWAALSLAVMTAGLTTQILVGGGAGVDPVWGANIPTAVTIGSAYIYRTAGTDVPVTDGGTGVSTLALNGILYGTGSTAVGVTAIGAEGQLLRVGASPFVPAWSTATFASTYVIGGLLHAAAANTIAALAPGAIGSFLMSNGASAALSYLAAGAANYCLVGAGVTTIPVWTAATGTGAPVLATSPTLVTPLLGTPASGVLSGCTGYPGLAITAGKTITCTQNTSLDEAVAMSSKLTGSYASAAEITAGTEAVKAIAPDQLALTRATAAEALTGVAVKIMTPSVSREMIINLKPVVNAAVNKLDIFTKSGGAVPDATNPIKVMIPDGNGYTQRTRAAAVASGTGQIVLADAANYWSKGSLEAEIKTMYLYAIWSTADAGIVWAVSGYSGFTRVPAAGGAATDDDWFLLEGSSSYTAVITDYCVAAAKIRYEYDTADAPDHTIQATVLDAPQVIWNPKSDYGYKKTLASNITSAGDLTLASRVSVVVKQAGLYDISWEPFGYSDTAGYSTLQGAIKVGSSTYASAVSRRDAEALAYYVHCGVSMSLKDRVYLNTGDTIHGGAGVIAAAGTRTITTRTALLFNRAD